ncbi:helix-turn-helix domain-containing protein [Segnochrobactrum spirostomi]|uniref:helix-turn-helix domain-containing protein n=1 Tax=Segnochrobactrum spirostomi TaxID=2608987 RepID=UPI001FEA4BA9|nr:AraC family transcriptional regulator [Segnochrobactrum spirostomi]
MEATGIAIAFPSVEAGWPDPDTPLLERVTSLLPEAFDTVLVHSASHDLGAFFSRLRAERLHAGFMICDLRGRGDIGLKRLASALLAARSEDATSVAIYADAIGAIIAARSVEGSLGGTPGKGRACGGLPKWRLKRVVDYIDTHLDQPITLADLGAAAKLTRMHFAAQFRATTGLRPHEYLLRRRIERAKTMLADDDLPIVEIALSVGFQTQAHFTTVFGRFVGVTPYQWRRALAAKRRTLACEPRRASLGIDRAAPHAALGLV